MADGHGGARQGAGRPKGSKSNHSKFQEARTRKELALAALRELELARRCGALIDREAAVLHWQNYIALARQRIWALPVRLAAICGTDAESRADIQREATIAVRELLEELAAAPPCPEEAAET